MEIEILFANHFKVVNGIIKVCLTDGSSLFSNQQVHIWFSNFVVTIKRTVLFELTVLTKWVN